MRGKTAYKSLDTAKSSKYRVQKSLWFKIMTTNSGIPLPALTSLEVSRPMTTPAERL
jgi:hypothetical protein